MMHILSPTEGRFASMDALLSPVEAPHRAGQRPSRATWGHGTANIARADTPRTRPTRTVLIVEDDPALLKVMSEHLARRAVRVLGASHYAAALAHLALGTPDLACVDIGLPTESGFELCEYMRGPLGLTTLPIMLTSESSWAADMAYAEEAGATAFLRKPFSMPEFEANILALLRGAHPSGEHTLHRAA
jgi:DNA-binding response OmpR family regulator